MSISTGTNTNTSKFTLVAATISIALGVVFTLGGCATDPMDAMNRGGDSQKGDVRGGPGNEILDGIGGDDVDIDLGGKSIPKDFPSQVPLVKGEIVSSGSITSEGDTMYTVQLMVTDPSVFENILADMTKAGFTEDFTTDGETRMGGFTGHGWGVLVTVGGAGSGEGRITVSYMVSADADDD